MIPRVDLTEPTAPAPGTLKLSRPVSSLGPGACEFQSNINIKTEIYVLKPFCVYSSLLLRCFIHHNISFGNHINSKCGLVQIWPETLARLQAVQNVLASVVDIGAKTDYDATETRMLKRACCHGGTESLRQANGLCFSILEHSINVMLNRYENLGV